MSSRATPRNSAPRWSRYLVPGTVGLVVIATVLTAVVHGKLTNRWREPASLVVAAERLAATPKEFGEWRLTDERELAPAVVETLMCQGYLNRVYTHRQTGDVVSVALLLGPPGPISVHTPEICYSSRDFRILRETAPVSLDDQGRESVWSLSFRAKALTGGELHVYYGWSNGGPWTASRQPRVEFGGQDLLYKIQLAWHAPPGANVDQETPALMFLRDFLPVIRPAIAQELAE